MSEEEIRYDLLHMEETDIVKKYLLSTEVWYFIGYQQMEYDAFLDRLDIMNKIIANHLGVCMKNILIVGSAKTGYSFSPTKLLKKFDSDDENESDLDIAIISDKYFSECWDLARHETSARYTRYYADISSGIFNGFICKKALEEIPSIRMAWNEKVRELKRELQQEVSIEHPINFRIYRSWEDLEAYHIRGIGKLKKIISEG